MLKLTYTENSFYLEHLTTALEEWVSSRVILALRTGTSLCVQASTASFLLPADLPQLENLETVVRREQVEAITISICDADYIEVSLQGSWLVSATDTEEGVFVSAMSYAVELFLSILWQEAQTKASALSE
ncbi:MAG: hypothetical protein F6K58_27505 [Symploca sp. SIO2E9]|nr:hypothetical protein [Symploca sp. SIO2E9]